MGILGIIFFPFDSSTADAQISFGNQIQISNSQTRVSSKDSWTFGIGKIKSSIPHNKTIGWHYRNYQKNISFAHNYTEDLSKKILWEFELTAWVRFKDSGFIMVYNSPPISTPLFLVEGKVFNLEFNSYDKSAGDFCQSLVEIEWQIYDNSQKKVIYTKNSFGVSTDSLIGEKIGSSSFDMHKTVSLWKAVTEATDQLIYSHDFLETIAKNTPSPPSAYSETKPNAPLPQMPIRTKPISFLGIKDKKTKKLNFDELLKAVISIKTESGHGSGFIINDEGYAVTNYHVLENSKKITAFLKGWKPINAELIKIDADKDLAIIKLAGEEYDYLPLGDNSGIKLGMDVYAAGAPISMGLSHSISKGIIGGIRKIKELDLTLLQTDASINPGNSGGPLLNEYGEAIGIVALKIAESGVEGLGFAISIDDAKRFLNLAEKK